MKRTRIRQAATATAICATVGAMIGIATGAAATSDDEASVSNSASEKATRVVGPGPGAPPGPGGPGFSITGGPPVHSEMVVPNSSGDGFVTITQDSGEVQSTSGSEITITEGTEEATYRTVTIDVPDDATIVRNGKKAELGELEKGDRVHISKSPQDSFVFAITSEHQKLLMQSTFKLRRGIGGERDLPPPPDRGELPPGLPRIAPAPGRGD